jgi:hypothetical protein
MTDQEINIAIAEVCGWKSVQVVFPDAREWYRHAEKKEICSKEDLPDYCGDLNAMHEAEKSLSNHNPEGRSEANNYATHLCKIAIRDVNLRIFATARQRAEAFLRTVGKWKEEA